MIDLEAFRPLSYVTGDVSPDGREILLRLQTERHGTLDVALPTVDLQPLLGLLLMLGGKAALRGRWAASGETFAAPPLPLHGASVGIDGGRGVLTVEIGAAVLAFSLPRASLAELGRAIAALAADAG